MYSVMSSRVKQRYINSVSETSIQSVWRTSDLWDENVQNYIVFDRDTLLIMSLKRAFKGFKEYLVFETKMYRIVSSRVKQRYINSVSETSIQSVWRTSDFWDVNVQNYIVLHY